MQVQQAVFTSARTNRACGYHVVARSTGIAEEIVGRLFAWGPTQGALADSDWDASSLNFFPLTDPWFGLSRTVYGGPEYSSRGGRQVVTVALVLSRQQLAGYDHNALTLARTALSLGHLRLLAAIPERLPTVDLPDSWPPYLEPARRTRRSDNGLVDTIIERLENSGRAAVIGAPRPLEVLDEILEQTPLRQRLALSFTTGLRPSPSRPFDLHFLPEDEAICRQYAALGFDGVVTRATGATQPEAVPRRGLSASDPVGYA